MLLTTDDHISEHFTWMEAACHNGTPVPPELRGNALDLAKMLERIRAFFGGVLVPVSWYRTPAYNKAIGGAPLSQHMTGGAVDIRPGHLRDLAGLMFCIDTMLERLELPELGGYGKYPAWVHLDVRQRVGNRLARWYGGAVGAEQ